MQSHLRRSDTNGSVTVFSAQEVCDLATAEQVGAAITSSDQVTQMVVLAGDQVFTVGSSGKGPN